MIQFIIFMAAFDPSSWNELAWSKHIAAEIGGKTEVRTPDGSRVDILTDEYAYEVDFCTKNKPYKHWESPSQAIFYASVFNRKPAVILLFDGSDIAMKSYLRCLLVCKHSNVRLEIRRINK